MRDHQKILVTFPEDIVGWFGIIMDEHGLGGRTEPAGKGKLRVCLEGTVRQIQAFRQEMNDRTDVQIDDL